MKRYAAFLRGVMPTNCKMGDLRAAFEAAGFEDVRTLLGSGNVLFGASSSSVSVSRPWNTDAIMASLATFVSAPSSSRMSRCVVPCSSSRRRSVLGVVWSFLAR